MPNLLSKFEGEELDFLLGKALEIHSGQNGWTKLVSTETEKLSLNSLLNPGNFAIEHWQDGPTELAGMIGKGHLSLINYLEDDIVRQYAFFRGITKDGYTRTYDKTSKTFTEWQDANLKKNSHLGPNAPAEEDRVPNMIWVDTTNENAPVFKYWNATTHEWIELDPADMLKKSVYDTAGKGEDFFAYADQRMAETTTAVNEFDVIGYGSPIEKSMQVWGDSVVDININQLGFPSEYYDANKTLKPYTYITNYYLSMRVYLYEPNTDTGIVNVFASIRDSQYSDPAWSNLLHIGDITKATAADNFNVGIFANMHAVPTTIYIAVTTSSQNDVYGHRDIFKCTLQYDQTYDLTEVINYDSRDLTNADIQLLNTTVWQLSGIGKNDDIFALTDGIHFATTTDMLTFNTVVPTDIDANYSINLTDAYIAYNGKSSAVTGWMITFSDIENDRGIVKAIYFDAELNPVSWYKLSSETEHLWKHVIYTSGDGNDFGGVIVSSAESNEDYEKRLSTVFDWYTLALDENNQISVDGDAIPFDTPEKVCFAMAPEHAYGSTLGIFYNPDNGNRIYMTPDGEIVSTVMLGVNGPVEMRRVGLDIEFRNIATDKVYKLICAYADQSDTTTYYDHINDSGVHVTTEDIERWSNKASRIKLQHAVNDAEAALKTEIVSKTNEFKNETDAMIAQADSLSAGIISHVNDKSIHLREPKMFTLSEHYDYENRAKSALLWTGSEYYKVTLDVDYAQDETTVWPVYVYRSTDGITWETLDTNATEKMNITDANFINGHMRLKLIHGEIVFFIDGMIFILSGENHTEWKTLFEVFPNLVITPETEGTVVLLRDYLYGGGRHVLLTSMGIYQWDNDGNIQHYAVGNMQSFALVYGNGIWLAVNEHVYSGSPNSSTGKYPNTDKAIYMYSETENVWKRVYGAAATVASAFFKNKFILVLFSGEVMYSENGSDWLTLEKSLKDGLSNTEWIPTSNAVGQTRNGVNNILVSNGDTLIGIRTSSLKWTMFWTNDGLTWTVRAMGSWHPDTQLIRDREERCPISGTLHYNNGFKMLLFLGMGFLDEYTTTQSYLDQKADAVHSHNLDHRIQMMASRIDGMIPLDQIPDGVRDVNKKVNNKDEMLALTIDDVQEGDFVWVADTKLLYRVVDEDLLGTDKAEEAFLKYSTGGSAMSWNNIGEIPQNIMDLGITDLDTKEVTNEKSNTLSTLSDANKVKLDAFQPTVDQVSAVDSAIKLQSDIDMNYEKLKLLNTYEIPPKILIGYYPVEDWNLQNPFIVMPYRTNSNTPWIGYQIYSGGIIGLDPNTNKYVTPRGCQMKYDPFGFYLKPTYGNNLYDSAFIEDLPMDEKIYAIGCGYHTQRPIAITENRILCCRFIDNPGPNASYVSTLEYMLSAEERDLIVNSKKHELVIGFSDSRNKYIYSSLILDTAIMVIQTPNTNYTTESAIEIYVTNGFSKNALINAADIMTTYSRIPEIAQLSPTSDDACFFVGEIESGQVTLSVYNALTSDKIASSTYNLVLSDDAMWLADTCLYGGDYATYFAIIDGNKLLSCRLVTGSTLERLDWWTMTFSDNSILSNLEGTDDTHIKCITDDASLNEIDILEIQLNVNADVLHMIWQSYSSDSNKNAILRKDYAYDIKLSDLPVPLTNLKQLYFRPNGYLSEGIFNSSPNYGWRGIEMCYFDDHGNPIYIRWQPITGSKYNLRNEKFWG